MSSSSSAVDPSTAGSGSGYVEGGEPFTTQAYVVLIYWIVVTFIGLIANIITISTLIKPHVLKRYHAWKRHHNRWNANDTHDTNTNSPFQTSPLHQPHASPHIKHLYNIPTPTQSPIQTTQTQFRTLPGVDTPIVRGRDVVIPPLHFSAALTHDTVIDPSPSPTTQTSSSPLQAQESIQTVHVSPFMESPTPISKHRNIIPRHSGLPLTLSPTTSSISLHPNTIPDIPAVSASPVLSPISPTRTRPARTPQMTIISFLLCLQAFVELVGCLLSLLFIGPKIQAGHYIGGSQGVWCQQEAAVLHLVVEINIGNLALIAYERRRTICGMTSCSSLPGMSALSWSRAVILHIGVWVLAILVSCVPFFVMAAHITEDPSSYGVHASGAACYGRGRTSIIFASLIYVLVLIPFVGYSYWAIHRYIKNTIGGVLALTGSGSSSPANKAFQKLIRQQAKIARLMAAFTLVFFACWLPVSISFLIGIIRPSTPEPVWWDMIILMSGLASYLINPFLYSYYNKDVKIALLRVFTCGWGVTLMSREGDDGESSLEDATGHARNQSQYTTLHTRNGTQGTTPAIV